jgi:transglutaminase-like putative cysteine protease
VARYTTLPGDVPQRVLDLAQEVAGSQPNPYDQARALEQFLRQYPYSLAIDSPPPSADPVDYFLFEQQTGYCDYYASAMVVLARAVGLPARLAIGYLAQPGDGSEVQIMRQIDGHSWPEIYFADFGWVAFEPTAAFATPHDSPLTRPDDFADHSPEMTESPPPPLPDVAPARPFPWSQLIIVAALAGGAFWLWRRGQLPAGQDVVVWSYGRLQQSAARLGQPPDPSQTPQEFLAAFQDFLSGYGRFPRLAKRIDQMQPHLVRLTALYVQHRYAEDKQSGRVMAWESWRKVKRPLWLLQYVKRET